MFRSTIAAKEQTQEQAGKEDLLIRFFESDWFDSWIALTCVPPCDEPDAASPPSAHGPGSVYHQHLPLQVWHLGIEHMPC